MIHRHTATAAVAILAAALLVSTTARAAGPRVSASGVGGGVEDRQLVDERATFREGETVWFWTRVVEGQDGDRIRHVWTRAGEEKLSVGLTIGGPAWRTWSNKRMHPGAAGSWTVVAVDADGAELARATFVCEPADGGAVPDGTAAGGNGGASTR